jgi:small conductance mechanosensitive channel
MNDQLATLEQAKSTIIDLGIKFGPKLFAAMVILAAGFVAARWMGRMLERSLRKIELEPPVRLLLVRVVRVLVLALFLVMAVQNLGVELLPLIAGVGVAGAGIALALQGVLSNIVAGLTIIFTKPYRVGEYIALVGVDGRVEVITLFSTTLSHADQSRVVVPNRKVVGEILHNYGKIRQLGLAVGISYDASVGAALAAIQEVLQANPRVLKDPAPVIQVSRLGESSIDIGISPWVSVPDYGAAISEVNKAVLEAFRSRRIVIPLPQREVRMVAQAG